MSHLGSFGAAVKELDPNAEKDSFDYFGERFEVAGTMPQVLMLQLGAGSTGKIPEQELFAALWEALRCSLDAGDEDGNFNRFYRIAVAKRASIEDLMELVMALFEVQAGRPTEEPRGSLPGPSTTSPSSSASSSGSPVLQGSSVHPAFAHLTPVNELVG